MRIKIWSNRSKGEFKVRELDKAYKFAVSFIPNLNYDIFKNGLDDMKIITISFKGNKIYLQKLVELD